MLFEDESMIRDYQAIQKTWFLRGKQRIIPTTGKHRGVKLLATVDYETGHIVWQEDEQYTAETLFLSSKGLGDLSNRETGSGFGQCPIHHAKLLRPFPKSVCVSGNLWMKPRKHPHAIIDRLCVRL
ncbi:hypothetical protein P7H21_20680 [Paenibacillus larvae]|nr:transposase [Paenibacillus larvae]MDT2305863.1 hypothetical protein [Paenibacillus larvae]